MTLPHATLFGELRSACAAHRTDEIEPLLCQILLHHPPMLGENALRYALSHVPAPAPWRWAWWLMCIEEGRAPVITPIADTQTADAHTFVIPSA